MVNVVIFSRTLKMYVASVRVSHRVNLGIQETIRVHKSVSGILVEYTGTSLQNQYVQVRHQVQHQVQQPLLYFSLGADIGHRPCGFRAGVFAKYLITTLNI
jgi:hypothetical protein